MACGGSPSPATPTGAAVSGSSGTYPQDLTITGYFAGHVTRAYGYCIKTGEGFQGYIQDTRPGNALRFDFRIPLSSYHGAGTYGPHEGNSVLGTVYMAGQATWTSSTGTFTVNGGEKAGSIHMHLVGGTGTPEDINGSWRCG